MFRHIVATVKHRTKRSEIAYFGFYHHELIDE